MPLTPGTRLGPYEIASPLGAGGMGEVYEAVDTRIDRPVAIKVLPEELARNRERRERLEREARAVSSLSHPHICTLFELDHEEEVPFLVMERLEGETLAERLRRGPLPRTEALRFGIQIADALEKAHRQGVVHRDLKPGNVMLTASGVKLLDFGLAKLQPTVAPGDSQAHTEVELTTDGALLGTLRYMSPEQLQGGAADARSDVWALGMVLYEMLTGRHPFAGAADGSAATAVSAILTADPAPFEPPVPPLLERIVLGCLARDPDERWAAAGDVRRQLEWMPGSPGEGYGRGEAVSLEEGPAPRGGRLVWSLLGAAVALAAGLVAFLVLPGLGPEASGPTPVTRMVLELPAGHHLVSGIHPLALSPDGRSLVYTATAGEEGDSRLFRHRLEEFEAQPIPETEGANDPFFSPDGLSLGYRQGFALRRLNLETGAVGTVADDVRIFRGATWAADDTIVFADLGRGLLLVPPGGGEPRPLAERDERGLHRFPEILPGGKGAIFSVGLGLEQRLAVLDLATGGWRTLEQRGAGARYLPTGHLVYGGGGQLRVAAFDRDSATMIGDPVTVVDEVFTEFAFGLPRYAVSPSGTLAYVVGSLSARGVWVDREGRHTPFAHDIGASIASRFSPDGTRLAATLRSTDGRIEVWILDLETGSRSKLAPGGRSFGPVWSPDGSIVTFMSSLGGGWHPRWQAADGSGRGGEIPLPDNVGGSVSSWHPDGERVAISGSGASWITTLDGTPERLWEPLGNEWGLRFHPSGDWVALTSDQSGRPEIYARSFPDGERTFALSTDGGVEPTWSADGTELFYRDGDRMMAVPIALDPFRPGRPRVLFNGRYIFTEEATKNVASVGNPNYSVTPDGQRFLMIERDEASLPRRIHLVINWSEELR